MSSKALMVSAAHWLVRRHSLDTTHIFDGINHFWRGVYGSSTIDTVEDKEENFKAFFKGDPARIMRSAPQFGCTLAGYEFWKTILPFPGKPHESMGLSSPPSARFSASLGA
jgi:hypothetical protein